MFNPEMNLKEMLIIKALRIYEEHKSLGFKYIGEITFLKLIQDGDFSNANEYFDCLSVLFALGMISQTNNEIRFNNHDTK